MKKRNDPSGRKDVFAIVELEDEDLGRVFAGFDPEVIVEANYGCAEGCTNNCPEGCGN